MLCFGLMRPYKGIDLLLEAWRGVEDAELWIVGHAAHGHLPAARRGPPGVRFVPRFISDDELPAYFRRADLVVLPYREIDQSGVAVHRAGVREPLLLSDVGGFPELARTGAARTFPAGDAAALHGALTRAARRPRCAGGDGRARPRGRRRASTPGRRSAGARSALYEDAPDGEDPRR